jgi:beta-N-acetylhexosaminidase
MIVVGFRGTTIKPDAPIADALRAGLGGVILFDRDGGTGKPPRNIKSPDQLAALTAEIRRLASGPVLVSIDQEGGRVARLGPQNGFRATRSQASIGRTDDPAVGRAAGSSMGRTMRTAGIDLDLAPVVDVDVDPRNPAIGALDRSFSADPAVVGAMAAAEIEGLHGEGIRAAIKHFPGLGSARANTDFDRVDVTGTWTRAELEPYQTLFGLGLPDVVMVGHILDRDLDPDRLASLSPAIVSGLLRQELGWRGPVMTDDLGAVAITATVSREEAIAQAIEAGDDLLLFANQAHYERGLAQEVIDTIVDLVVGGRIAESRLDASLARLDPLFAAAP